MLGQSNEFGAIRILHVDDEPNQLQFANTFLSISDPSFKIESVSSPIEALLILKKGTFDCVISDFKMPGLNGIELASRIRETSDVPILIYTGRGSLEVAEAAFTAGIDDYVRKELNPSHYKVLAKRIKSVVEKHRIHEALREAKERYENLFSFSPNAIFSTNMKGYVTAVNKAALRLSGYRRYELVREHFLKMPLFKNSDVSTYSEKFLSVLNGEIPEPFEVSMNNKEGKKLIAKIHLGVIEIAGKRVGVQAIFQDITQHRNYERELKWFRTTFRSFVEDIKEIEDELREMFDNSLDVKFFRNDLALWRLFNEPLNRVSETEQEDLLPENGLTQDQDHPLPQE